MAEIFYAYVSTREEGQVLDRQMDALKAASCERVFEDRASGARTDQPVLTACLNHLRRGDVLVVLDLDRLGRRAGELIRLIDELRGGGVGFRALNASFDITTPAGRAFHRSRRRSPRWNATSFADALARASRPLALEGATVSSCR